ncbi:unnamed protein product [Timema podura]|uniref:Uncharacterized protein n=1 Tax=Timema podura TaxID=61482 RepID=A0ABN7NJI8_TIMPD|nr:unnamed protein product [Timema podura]
MNSGTDDNFSSSEEREHVDLQSTSTLPPLPSYSDKMASLHKPKERDYARRVDCVMSPEVPTQSDFLHQRTQSLDSLSSGHSSGSGFNPENLSSRRRVVVKPFEEPDQEEVPSFMRWRHLIARSLALRIGSTKSIFVVEKSCAVPKVVYGIF